MGKYILVIDAGSTGIRVRVIGQHHNATRKLKCQLLLYKIPLPCKRWSMIWKTLFIMQLYAFPHLLDSCVVDFLNLLFANQNSLFPRL